MLATILGPFTWETPNLIAEVELIPRHASNLRASGGCKYEQSHNNSKSVTGLGLGRRSPDVTEFMLIENTSA